MKTMFRPLSIVSALVVLLIITQPAMAELIDRVVAVVNNDIITLSDLNREGGPYFNQVIRNVPSDQLETELHKVRQEVLNHLIDQMLIDQKAAEYDLNISDEEVDEALQSMLAEKNISMERFMKDITRMGDTVERYRNQIRTQILRQRLVTIDIRSKIVITEDKMQKYYDQKYAREQTKDGYHLLQIGLSLTGNGRAKSEQEAYEMMTVLREHLMKGQNFQELARNYSELPSATEGGDLGIIKLNEMAADMREAVKDLKPEEISQIIKSNSNYQLLKLLSAKHGDISVQIPYEAVKDEIREQLFQQQMEASYEVWLEELRSQAYIKQNI